MSSNDPRYRTREWRSLRVAILDRDGWRCQIRGAGCSQAGTCVDHIIAVADGGPFWDPGNLRGSCWGCNTRRGAERTNATRAAARAPVTRF